MGSLKGRLAELPLLASSLFFPPLGYATDAMAAGYPYTWQRLGVPEMVDHTVRAALAKLAAEPAAELTAELAAEPGGGATTASPPPTGSAEREPAHASAHTSAPASCRGGDCDVPSMRCVRELIPAEVGAEYWMVRATMLHVARTAQDPRSSDESPKEISNESPKQNSNKIPKEVSNVEFVEPYQNTWAPFNLGAPSEELLENLMSRTNTTPF